MPFLVTPPRESDTSARPRAATRGLRRRVGHWLIGDTNRAQPNRQVPPLAPQPLPVLVRPHVLVAGADGAQMMLLRRTLEIDGCDVTATPSGATAVDALLEQSPDLLLINAPLADASAVALLRWVRSRPQTADLSCMAIVRDGETQLVASLYDAGADVVISRPTELDLLSRRVTAALSRRPVPVPA